MSQTQQCGNELLFQGTVLSSFEFTGETIDNPLVMHKTKRPKRAILTGTVYSRQAFVDGLDLDQ